MPSAIESEGVEVVLGAGILGWVAERGEVKSIVFIKDKKMFKKK